MHGAHGLCSKIGIPAISEECIVEEPFITQIVPYAFPFAPKNWAFCDGSQLTASQYAAVFALLGNLYNTTGDGRTSFNLPDLRGRVPIHRGIYDNVVTQQGIAYQGGIETFQLPAAALPLHTHQVYAENSTASSLAPAGAMYATLPSPGTPPITGRYTTTPATTAAMDAGALVASDLRKAARERVFGFEQIGRASCRERV